MAGDTFRTFEYLLQSVISRSRQCSEIWNRISVHKESPYCFEVRQITGLSFNSNGDEMLVFTVEDHEIAFESLEVHFEEVVAAKANKRNDKLPRTDTTSRRKCGSCTPNLIP
eukprot:TRINITY_DN13499_c0_g1_i1.p1 TRINITY_DN13499_c0_g1~~TRINITY_DN13499_c0_g1_i1.p1  ORF type:complete len:112 (+),score=9.42 TRINITY_DN13499_c0_g1_i1:18-353(+)